MEDLRRKITTYVLVGAMLALLGLLIGYGGSIGVGGVLLNIGLIVIAYILGMLSGIDSAERKIKESEDVDGTK